MYVPDIVNEFMKNKLFIKKYSFQRNKRLKKYEQSLEFGYLPVIKQIVIRLGRREVKYMLVIMTAKMNLQKFRNVRENNI